MLKSKEPIAAALFALPALAPLAVFWIYPIAQTVWISFTDWDYMTPEYKMVGFKNYARLLASRDFSQALSNTLVFCVFSAVFSIALGLGMALLLEKKFKGK
ncbi:MAG: sugar ABC transporter permease, partial [Clostridiales bacterium]|nr:sugar ABC transporter permease [Clostridiales bacterium]